MSSPWPTPQYLVAFNNGPLDDPALITTVATPGTVGGANVWTDITAYVESHHIVRGRQHEFDQFEAGVCDLVLDNSDARFNPWNTAGPYYGLLKPKKLMQVRATWAGTTYTRFTGHVNAWPVVWADPVSATAEVQASDACRLLQAADITTTGYPAQVRADGATHYWRLGDPVGSSVASDALSSNLLTYTVGAGPGGTFSLSVGSFTFGSTPLIPVDPTSSMQLTTNATFPKAFGLAPVTDAPLVMGAGISSEAIFELPTSYPSDGTLIWDVAFTVSGVRKHMAIQAYATGISVVDDISNNAQAWSASLADGNPHHLIVTLTSAWLATVYLDGVSLGSFTMPAFSTDTHGYYSAVQQTAGATNCTANVQEWALYSSVLSSAQAANHHTLASVPQQLSGARVGRVLDAIGWSSGARSVDAGYSNVQAVTSSLTQTSSLSHIQDCETTEAGAFYVTNDGKARFISRDTLWTDSRYQTVQATFGDNPSAGEIPFLPGPAIGLDDIDIYNEATGQRAGGLRQTITNPTSITEYGRNTWQPTGSLLGTSDIEVLSRLRAVLNVYSEPVTRLSSITVDLADLLSPDHVGALFSLELLYRVAVNRHGVPGGGDAFSQIGLVEHIEEQASVDSWVVTLALDPADTSVHYFAWGDSASTWGGSAVWGF